MNLKLLVATHNQGKVREYHDLLADLPLSLTYLDPEGITFEVEETGQTFADNAVLKATEYARARGLLTWADDSGLIVDALDGAPGVQSARYAGPGAGDADRYHKLLDALAGVPWGRRSARFHCCVALAIPDGLPEGAPGDSLPANAYYDVSRMALPAPFPGRVLIAEGQCEGVIAFGPAGDNGFGYDPVFYVPEQGATMAQLPPALKNQISHRARAAQAAARLLHALFAGAAL